MKRCVFQSLLMLSLQERKARRVEFHPRVTVIKGPNDTGKSSLVKTIYHTFSPIPPQLHQKWKDAEVRSVVRFTIDDVAYSILKDGGKYTVFDSDNARLITATSVTTELAPFIATLFNFKLQLQSKTSDNTQATPAFLFLPFYVDQDMSWTRNWASFTRLQQFSRWRRDTAEYHIGVRPNEYYQAKSGLARIQSDLTALQQRRDVLQGVLKRLTEELAKLNFNIDIDAYRKEIENLLIYCNRLQKQEEELKKDLARVYNNKAAVDAQIALTNATAKELRGDYRYAVEGIPADQIECPTCGTQHQNSFIERFAIAKDEQRCKELLVELQSEQSGYDQELSKLRTKYSGTSAELEETRALLNQKQGDVTLQQLIESEGRKEARSIVEKDIADVNRDIGQIDSDARQLDDRMKLYDNKERRATIRTQYLGRMKRFLTALEVVNLSEDRYKSFDANIPESGSDLPRALLAYYYSILHAINENDSATVCPIVIDSPRQQDQDQVNWLRILNFMRDNQPTDTQLILSLVEDSGVNFGGTVIELDEKLSVLTKEQYDSVAGELLPLIQASNAE
jgi:hypothetical protein